MQSLPTLHRMQLYPSCARHHNAFTVLSAEFSSTFVTADSSNQPPNVLNPEFQPLINDSRPWYVAKQAQSWSSRETWAPLVTTQAVVIRSSLQSSAKYNKSSRVESITVCSKYKISLPGAVRRYSSASSAVCAAEMSIEFAEMMFWLHNISKSRGVTKMGNSVISGAWFFDRSVSLSYFKLRFTSPSTRYRLIILVRGSGHESTI